MSYGSWISGLVNDAKKKAEAAVQNAVQGVQTAVNNAVQGAQTAVQNALPSVQSAVQNTVQNVQTGVQNAINEGQAVVNDALGGYGEWVGGVKNAVGDIVSGTQGAVQNATQAAQNAGAAVADHIPAVQSAVQNVVDKAQNAAGVIAPAVENVHTGIQNLQEGVQNAVQTAQPIVEGVQNAVQTGKEVASGVVQGVQQGAQAIQNNVNAALGGNVNATPAPEQTVQTPAQAAPEVQTPTQTMPGQTAPEVQTPTQEDHIDSYEEYLNKQAAHLSNVKDKTTAFYDEQNQKELSALDEMKAAGDAHAKDTYDTTAGALDKQKEEIYKYADEQLAGDLGYNQEAYDKLVTSITEQMEAGKISAADAKELLMLAAEEAKNLTYASAERQREEAERAADIARERAIADANSAYAQNRAGYGAKAEAMGSMGLTGGGYSDYLENAAYAQNRSETQAARAQSDTAKREAKYTEDQTKLSADSQYNDKKYAAESDYLQKLHDIDTTYRTNMSEAEQAKLAADKQANDTAAGLKADADAAHREGSLQNDLTYKGQLYENEQNYTSGVRDANKTAEAGKLQAELDYVEAIMNNEGKLAEYKESLKAGDAAAEEKLLALYEQMIRGAGNGTYTADDVKTLSDAFGFSEEWTNAAIKATENYNSGITETKNEATAEQTSQRYTSLLTGAANGTYNEATVRALAKEWGFNEEQTNEAVKAAQGYATEKGTETALSEAAQAGKTFVGVLDSIAGGAFDGYSADQISQIAQNLGITLTDEQKKLVTQAMSNRTGDISDGDTEYKNGIYHELLVGAKNGAYTAEEMADFIKRYGLDEGMATNLNQAVSDYNTNKTTAEANNAAANKTNNFIAMLDDVKAGKYDASEISEIAAQLGFDINDPTDNKLIDMLTGAAGKHAEGVAEMDEATKAETFANLLGMASSGQLNSAELREIAKGLGFDESADSYKFDLLDKAVGRYNSGREEDKAAAKTTNFIALLDGANSGAYSEEQIKTIATELGFDINNKADKSLIDMLTSAAKASADEETAAALRADTEYMNGVYAELLTAANNGDFDEGQIRSLAEKFGFEGDDVEELALAAQGYKTRTEQEKAETEAAIKNENFVNLMAESGDALGYVQSAIDAGMIDKAQGGKYLTSYFKSGIDSGEAFDSYEVKNALDEGYITESDFKNLQKNYSNTFDYKSSDLFKENGTAINSTTAYNEMMGAYNDPLLTDEAKFYIAMTAYNTYYENERNSKVTLWAAAIYNELGPKINPTKFKEQGYRSTSITAENLKTESGSATSGKYGSNWKAKHR